jgi:hypothetical protein
MGTITVRRGDDHRRDLTVRQPNGTPYDLTGTTLWFTLKERAEDADPGVFQHKTGVGTALVVTNAPGGLAAHRMTAAETAALLVGKAYRYDYQLKAADGTVATLDEGELVATADVTRSTT